MGLLEMAKTIQVLKKGALERTQAEVKRELKMQQLITKIREQAFK